MVRLGNLACRAEVRCSAKTSDGYVGNREFPPTEERDASVKTFEFTRVICYDVSGVERIYQFLLQCLQSDVYAAADNFRGYRALLPLSPSEGR